MVQRAEGSSAIATLRDLHERQCAAIERDGRPATVRELVELERARSAPAWFGRGPAPQDGILVRSGYGYAFWFPAKGGVSSERGPGVTDWVATAWPLVDGEWRDRCFVLLADGRLFEARNATGRFCGPGTVLVPEGVHEPVSVRTSERGPKWSLVERR